MRVVLAVPGPPWPSRRGYQLRAAQLVTALSNAGHEVVVVAQRGSDMAIGRPPDGVGYHEVALTVVDRLRGLVTGALIHPLQVAIHRQQRFTQVLERARTELDPDVAVVVLSRLGSVAPVLAGLPVIVDLVDDLALNMRRRARRQKVLAPLWRWEAARLDRWHRTLLVEAAATTVVATRDRDSLVARSPELDGRVEVVPLAIERASPRPWPERPIVALTGNLGYFPTVDGARWFAERVWPQVRRQIPEAEWWCAGARPPATVRRLADLEGVRVIGDPDDLASIRRQARVAIAPMRAGSGTAVKILEAMADGVPVAATLEAAAGLDAPLAALALATDADGLASAVVALLDDPRRAATQAATASSWLTSHHGPEVVGRKFVELVERVSSGQVSTEGR